MRHRITITCILAMIVAGCLIGAASPETKCARCGAVRPCTKMCKLVCEDKNVEVVCWGCKCEEFCQPGSGCPTCEHCKTVCENCKDGEAVGEVCSEPKRFFWWDWRPSCAEKYTRTKLMRRIETVKVPTYKWVLEDVCCECAAHCDCDESAPMGSNPDASALPEPKAK